MWKIGDSEVRVMTTQKISVELYKGDCLEIMDTLIAMGVKVDAVLTSPPYDDLREYNGNVSQWTFEKFKLIADNLYKILSDNGVMIWVVGDKTKNGSESGTSFKQALYFKEIGFNLHDTMLYKKANFVPLTHNRYEQCFEYMFVLSKGKPKTFNPILIPCKNAGKIEKYGLERRGLLDKNQSMRLYKETCYKPTKETKIHENIFEYTVGAEKTGHPAVFPLQLAKDQIQSWSNEGDTILDPFMGSGTTGVACKRLGRNFIGIELDDNYFNIAKERINDTRQS